MKDHFRGVVMAKPEGGAYRYQIVGILVTDRPIPELEHDQVYLDGTTFGALGDCLASVRGETTTATLGTSDQILTGLSERVPNSAAAHRPKEKAGKPEGGR